MRGRTFRTAVAATACALLAPAALGEGGNNAGSATIIEELPYFDTGDTSDNSSTSTASCGDFGGRDVWYRYTATQDVRATISLCCSEFDTVLWVTDGSLVEIACNDDHCDAQSQLTCLLMEAGMEYFIVVDGADGDSSGPYELRIDACPEPLPCDVCAPGAIMEGEPPCGDEYVDSYNGGCNSSPPVFQPINCDDVICGESGTFLVAGEPYRDTDWYELVLTETSDVTWDGNAEFPLLMMIFDGSEPCPSQGDPPLIAWNAGAPCEQVMVIVENLVPGTYWLWAGPSAGSVVPCGSVYNARVTCTPPPCEVECEPGAILEGEPDCYPGYLDLYNSGCDVNPPAFLPFQCDTTVCGTYGTWEPQMRDTDWYRYVSPGNETLTFTAKGEFEIQIFLIDAGSEDCQDHEILDTDIAGPMETATIERNAEPGVYWLWVGSPSFTGVPCGSIYNMTLASDNCQPVSCPEDLNGDLVVNVLDLLLVLAAWDAAGGVEDVNGDGIVNVLDLLLVLGAWGPCE